MKYKALIFDFDGTAIKYGQFERPTQKVINAVKKAQQKLFVSGATGRPFVTAKWIFDDLQLTNPSIISAGTKIVNPVTGEILWQVTIPKHTVEDIFAITNNYGYKTITESQFTTFPEQPLHTIQEENLIYIVDVPKDKSEKLIKDLETINNITIHTVKAYIQNNLDLHITHVNGTKEHAVVKLEQLLGVTKNEVIGIGDSFNDLPLFEGVGLKVAMGDGADELKKRADYIAPSSVEDGVADVIEKFILTEQ